MIQVSADVLALSGEAALLARGGRIIYQNAAAAHILGEDAAGKSLRSVLGEEIAEAQAPSFLSELSVGEQRYLVRANSYEGTRVFFLSPCAVAQTLLNDAFLYELRSFLMEMHINIELLRSRIAELGDRRGAEDLNALCRSFFRVGNVLFNLSVIRNTANHSLCFNPQPFDFSALMSELCEGIRFHIPEPELKLSVPGPLPIRGDPELLQRMVINLVSNCLRHAEGCTQISIHVHRAGEMLIVSVDDNGCGIPSQALPKVFDRYAHGFDLSDIGHGAGLGLSAARGIARLHGGTLLLESREGIGTAVRISLSRDPKPVYPVGVREPAYEESFNPILTGLADCLPLSSFSEAYTE